MNFGDFPDGPVVKPSLPMQGYVGLTPGKGTQENCSATWLAVSGFMVMGLDSGWSLDNHSDSESFLVVHTSLSQDGC